MGRIYFVVINSVYVCLFFSFGKAVHSVCLCLLASFSQPFVSFWKISFWRFLYLSTLVSANRLFMMPRAPTPPEKPFWRELELDWRGCPMAISDSCFCIIARLTCGEGTEMGEINGRGNIFAVCVWKWRVHPPWKLCETMGNTMCRWPVHLISQVGHKGGRWWCCVNFAWTKTTNTDTSQFITLPHTDESLLHSTKQCGENVLCSASIKSNDMEVD